MHFIHMLVSLLIYIGYCVQYIVTAAVIRQSLDMYSPIC